MPEPIEPGTISWGTCRDEDLALSFGLEIEYLVETYSITEKRIPELSGLPPVEDLSEYSSSDLLWVLGEQDGCLNAIANEYGVPNLYFGTQEGDGACFGFWLNEEEEE